MYMEKGVIRLRRRRLLEPMPATPQHALGLGHPSMESDSSSKSAGPVSLFGASAGELAMYVTWKLLKELACLPTRATGRDISVRSEELKRAMDRYLFGQKSPASATNIT